jgi:hypothetical protein
MKRIYLCSIYLSTGWHRTIWNKSSTNTYLYNNSFVRFEVFTVMTMKNAVFWDVMPCGCYKNQYFGGKYCLYHQGDKNRWARNALAVPSNQSMLQLLVIANAFLARWFLSPWWWRQCIPLKCWFLQEPHMITSQKAAFFNNSFAWKINKIRIQY